MNTKDFHTLSAYILRSTGMNIPESNISTVASFVEENLERLGGLTMDAYLDLMSRETAELCRFLSGITINETYFFREEKQFFLIRDVLLAEWCRNWETPLQLWSASCSTGEEALSLYALMNTHCRRPSRLLASDVSQAVLDRFHHGEYRHSRFRQDGNSLKPLMESLIVSGNERNFRIDPEVLQQIEKKRINVFKDDLSDLPGMDLILFRNTLIYMSPQNKQIVVQRLVDKLNPRGILFLSVSETPLISHPGLLLEEKGGIYYFRKTSSPVPPQEKAFTRGKTRLPRPSSLTRETRTALSRTDRTKRRKIHPKKKEQAGKVNAQVIYRQISEGMKSSVEDLKKAPGVVRSYLDVLSLLEEQDFGKARKLLSDSRDMMCCPGLYHFFQGYLLYSSRHPQEAYKEFQEALKGEPALWPARFYLTRSAGDSLSRQQREKELRRILRDIQEYIQDKRFDFQFLLEGFNARYFEMICRRELEHLQTRSDWYVHQ